MAAAYPGPFSVHVPSHKGLVVDFARNIKRFPVNRYTQTVPVTKLNDYYQRMTIEEAGRVLSTTLDDKLWADGQPRPERNEGGESFEFFPYRCERYYYGLPLGDLTISNADWDVSQQHLSIYSRQAMTARTQLAITQLTTTGNYAASHVINASTFSSSLGTNQGTWVQSTTARQDIKRSLFGAAEVIRDDTLDALEMDELILVINSELAAEIALSQEIVDYIKASPEAPYFIKGEGKAFNPNSDYGLPDKLYGFSLVVEGTRKITSAKGAAAARSQILPTATPFLCARPGGLEAPVGPNFSTCVGFAFLEMGVETVNDAINKRQLLGVTEVIDYQLAAPASGVLFTAAS
jgi:hypothetical protein